MFCQPEEGKRRVCDDPNQGQIDGQPSRKRHGK